MSETLLCEIEKLDLEFSSLSNRKLNKKDLEYRKYLISKLQRLSKEYLRSCGIRVKYKLEKILMKNLKYHIKTYFKFFNFSNIAVRKMVFINFFLLCEIEILDLESYIRF